MTTNLFLTKTDHILIPSELLRAVRDFKGFADVHINYYVRYGGLIGMCTYQDAFEYLVRDLREHDLPVKYSSFRSFKSMKTRNR